jgi:dTDP-3-amino-3,4,6-trideoxy-alpha-D-glucose transaminase
MKIPFVDVRWQYRELKREINSGVREVFGASNFILGEQTGTFEKEFAAYLGVKHFVGTACGSDALTLALRALGVGPGDEVITVANTFISTVLPIVYLGAKPVLVDASARDYQIEPGQVKKAITAKTKVIIPVHLFGIPAPLPEIKQLAAKRGIKILEDACQAHGAAIGTKKCGSFGDLAAFSFYPGKNLGAAGDAGGIATNDSRLDNQLRAMRNIGQFQKNHHDIIGYNSRLDTIQAQVLRVKLKKLDAWNRLRRHTAEIYKKNLAGLPVVLPPDLPKAYLPNFHLYVIRCQRRDELAKFLADHDISTGIHYPVPVHLQPAMAHLKYRKGSFPVSERMAGEMISLPMYAGMTAGQARYVCAAVRRFFAK